MRRRVAWGLLDQVLSSASNLLATIIAARSLPATDFGAFAVGFAVCVVSVFVVRGVASDPMLSAHAGGTEERLRWAARAGSGTVVVFGAVLALVVAALGWGLDGLLGGVLLALAVVVPGIVLQDFLRFALLVRGQARGMFLNDLLWLVVQIPLMILVVEMGGGAAALILAWGASGTAAALVGLAQVRALPRPLQAVAWLREHRRLWPYFTLDNIVFQATNVGLVLVVAAVTSLAQVGAFRAVMTLYSPLTVIGRGLVGVAVPELARRREQPRAVGRLALIVGWLLTPLALVWAVLLLALPDSAGEWLLGESWLLAEPLLWLAGLTTAAGLFTVGTVVGIRALGSGKEGLTARVLVGVMAVAVGALGAYLDGARGVMISLVVTAPIRMLIWGRLLSRAVRQRELEVVPAGAEGGVR